MNADKTRIKTGKKISRRVTQKDADKMWLLEGEGFSQSTLVVDVHGQDADVTAWAGRPCDVRVHMPPQDVHATSGAHATSGCAGRLRMPRSRAKENIKFSRWIWQKKVKRKQ
jgi:hypothetical protein